MQNSACTQKKTAGGPTRRFSPLILTTDFQRAYLMVPKGPEWRSFFPASVRGQFITSIRFTQSLGNAEVLRTSGIVGSLGSVLALAVAASAPRMAAVNKADFMANFSKGSLGVKASGRR